MVSLFKNIRGGAENSLGEAAEKGVVEEGGCNFAGREGGGGGLGGYIGVDPGHERLNLPAKIQQDKAYEQEMAQRGRLADN